MRTPVMLAVLGACSIARAETFVIDYTGRAQLDPAETFEADCLGASEAPDCSARASLLEAELVEGLAELEGLSDDATQALFSNAVGSSSDAVKQVGLRYFSRRRDLPSTLWTTVKEFFLGPDPQIGQPSAEILGFSTDGTDQELSELYLDLRPSHIYDSDSAETAGEQDDLWALACASDALLDAVPGFAENEQFTPAARLLMIDRFVAELTTGKASIPSSGFVTDAPKADVISFFDKLFGKTASPPVGDAEAQLRALNAELLSLQGKLASGDQAAIRRVTEIGEQISKLSTAVTTASMLALDGEACPDCVFWYAGADEDIYGKPFTRAVIVGTQPQLKRTTISYLGSGGAAPSTPSDGGTPTQGSDGGTPAQASDAGVDEQPSPTKKSDGGCSTTGDAAGGAWLLALGLLLLRRRQFGQFM